jgi:hypothetical protein
MLSIIASINCLKVYWQAWFPAPAPASEPYRLITAHSAPSNGIGYIQTTAGAITHGDQSARHRPATSHKKTDVPFVFCWQQYTQAHTGLEHECP